MSKYNVMVSGFMCKACNKCLSKHELIRKNPNTGVAEELCTECLNSIDLFGFPVKGAKAKIFLDEYDYE